MAHFEEKTLYCAGLKFVLHVGKYRDDPFEPDRDTGIYIDAPTGHFAIIAERHVDEFFQLLEALLDAYQEELGLERERMKQLGIPLPPGDWYQRKRAELELARKKAPIDETTVRDILRGQSPTSNILYGQSGETTNE